MPRGHWLDEDDLKKIRALYADGFTHCRVAKEVGISREAVGDALKKTGGSRRRGPAKKVSTVPLSELRKRYEDGESIQSLSRSAQIGVRAVRMRLIEAGATLRVDRCGWRKRPAGD
jgi:hypothetical protein